MNVQIEKVEKSYTTINIETPSYFSFDGKEFKIISDEEIVEVKTSKTGWHYIHIQKGVFAEGEIKRVVSEGAPSNADNFFNALRGVYESVNDVIKEENNLVA